MPIILLPDTSGSYFTIAEGRAADPTFAGLTDDDIANARAEVEDEIEALCDVAFVPRTAQAIIDGSNGTQLILPHMYVRSVTAVRAYTTATVYTDFTADEVADIVPSDTGVISRSSLGYWLGGFRNLRVDYTHGMDAPPPRVKRAALILLRYRLAGARWRIASTPVAVDAEGNPTADRIDADQGDGVTRRKSTGIPDVDAELEPWLGGVPVIA